MTPLTAYRPCVGIILFDVNGQVWLGKRYGQTSGPCWQFPQGGIDDGESAADAAQREIVEETGVDLANLTLIDRTQEWLTYDFPLEYKGKKTFAKDWRGQKQKWFAYRYHGDMSDFNLTRHLPQEFSEWKWANLADTPMLIVPFKRRIYERLADIFGRFSSALTAPD